MPASRHVRSLWSATAVHEDALGTIRRLTASAFAPGVLAATFGMEAAGLPAFPRTVHDPLIVADQ